MAEANVGDITARLRIDATAWQQGLQQAQQQLAQFQQQLGRQGTTAQQVQQNLTGVSQATGQMSQQMQQATRAASQVQQSLGGVTQTTSQITQAMGAATRATSAWGQVLQTASAIGLAVTLDRIVQALGRFLQNSVLLTARMQDLNRSFVAIEGSAAAANRTMAGLFDVAQRVGVSFTGLAESFRRLEAGAKGRPSPARISSGPWKALPSVRVSWGWGRRKMRAP